MTGEQASETPPLEILYGRGAIRFLGSVSYATARRPIRPLPLHRLRPRRLRHHHVAIHHLTVSPPRRLAADKKAAEEAAAATAAATANWPTGGYNSLIPLLFISVCAVLAICVDVSTICLVRENMIKYQYVLTTVYVMLKIYSWINLIKKLLIFSTIQKPNMCRQFLVQGFADALKPAPLTGTYFKRWQTKTALWLTSMNVFWIAGITPIGTITPEKEKAFRDATVIFIGAVLSVIRDKLVDAYLHMQVAKDLWDALENKFGATDAGSEMYAMEQFHDYRMVENRSVLEQAHEIQCIAKELEVLKCVLPSKFVAGCIIAKLPLSWRNFATTLKHQRREFSVEDVIGHLSVEQNSRAKDSHGKRDRRNLCRQYGTEELPQVQGKEQCPTEY